MQYYSQAQKENTSDLSKDAAVFTPTMLESNAQRLPNQFSNMQFMNYSQQQQNSIPANNPTTAYDNYGMNSAFTTAASTTATATATTATANQNFQDAQQANYESYKQEATHATVPAMAYPGNTANQLRTATDFRTNGIENPYAQNTQNFPNSFSHQQNPYNAMQKKFDTAMQNNTTTVNPYENYNNFNNQNNNHFESNKFGNKNNYFGSQDGRQNYYHQNRQGGGRRGGGYNNHYQQNNRYNNFQRGGYRGGRGRGYGNNNRGGYNNRPQMYWKETGPRHSEYEGMVGGSRKKDEQLEKRVFGSPSVSQGINFDDYDNINVEVGNYEGFQPMQAFEEAGLSPRLLENVKKCGFRKPTPIQKYTLPPALERRDIMACAQTGSGKTAAFLLPIVQNLLATVDDANQSRKNYDSKSFPKALIISPTRELAQQIHKDAVKFVYRTGLSSACIFGGSVVEKQLTYLKNYRIDILIATVGRLWDFFQREALSFERVEYLVLDEADRMLDMGFEKDIMNIIYKSDIRQERTNLLFSATMPQDIQTMAASFLQNYVFLACGRVGAVGHLITQQFELVQQDDKTDRLTELLNSVEGRCLVFTATKRKADELEYELNQLKIRCVAIHGDKSQHAREKALKQFRSKRCQVMIATDVASRGLDIPDVMYVIQYDVPDNIDSYVHRIGRTGRCGNKGTAISFLNDNNKPILKPLVNLLIEEKVEIPPWLNQLKMRHGNFRPSKRGRGRGRYGKRNYRGRGGGRGRGRYQQNNYYQNQGGYGNNFQQNPNFSNNRQNFI